MNEKRFCRKSVDGMRDMVFDSFFEILRLERIRLSSFARNVW